jgi:hypothetical protein
MTTKTVDLMQLLGDNGNGWKITPEIALHDATERVADPTRPGEWVWGPAIVQLEVPPDGAHILHVR